MLNPWNGMNGFEQMFEMMDRMRGEVDRVFQHAVGSEISTGAWPRANLLDARNKLILTAEVPGFTEQDVQVTVQEGVLTIRGERKLPEPEGYEAQRRERHVSQFARSFALPCPVQSEAEATSATIKDGILTVTLEKVADAVPRQITIKTLN